MVGRTHDLVAFTAMNIVVATQPLPPMTLATALVAFGTNMIGGLVPDLDDANSRIWSCFRGGSIVGKIVDPFIGHRNISHSILGIFLFAVIGKLVTGLLSSWILIDWNVAWWAFMIGVVSHLAADAVTRDGIPLFFPLHWKVGFPPIKFLRIKTGGLIETFLVFPGLILLNIWLFYSHYSLYVSFFKHLVSKS